NARDVAGEGRRRELHVQRAVLDRLQVVGERARLLAGHRLDEARLRRRGRARLRGDGGALLDLQLLADARLELADGGDVELELLELEPAEGALELADVALHGVEHA